MSSVRFNGWDWTELAEAWNLYIPESYAGKDMYEHAEKMRLHPELWLEHSKYIVRDENGLETVRSWSDLFGSIDYLVNEYENFNGFDPIVWYINLALQRSWKKDCNAPSRVLRKMANDVRCFSEALAKDTHTYYGPLWEGISKIEHDEVILRIISNNYPLLAAMWD